MWFYNFGLILYVWAIRLVAPRHPKARLWIEGRKDLFRRMREAIAPTDRIIWIHVASLGEFEQGRPIIEQLRKTHPEYKILLTFFSPSGYEIRKNYKGVDYIFYLPIDTPRNARRFDNVLVAGDTRFDRVAEIARAARRIDVIDRFKGDNRLFVAGSTWEPDEELLIRLINDNPDVKFVVAPHEMDESRIARLMAETKGGALRYTQCTPRTTYGSRQLLILDTVGILASVYGYATWSYIGGGFGVGIHNTLEAATFGLPVAFGPNYEKFKEARDLVTLGAARSVTDYEQLRTWFVPSRTVHPPRLTVCAESRSQTGNVNARTAGSHPSDACTSPFHGNRPKRF